MQDSAFDLDTLLAELLATSFWRGINADLTTGDGNGRPFGVVPSVTASNATSAATAINTDDLIDLIASVNADYAEDFSKYKIRMVRDFRFIRLNELLAEYLSVGIFGCARADHLLVSVEVPDPAVVHLHCHSF